jgi:hypothetical protein
VPEGKLTPELSREYEVCRVWMLVMEEWQVYFETDDQDTNKGDRRLAGDPRQQSQQPESVMPKREAAAAWHAAQDIDVAEALQPLVPEITADGG